MEQIPPALDRLLKLNIAQEREIVERGMFGNEEQLAQVRQRYLRCLTIMEEAQQAIREQQQEEEQLRSQRWAVKRFTASLDQRYEEVKHEISILIDSYHQKTSQQIQEMHSLFSSLRQFTNSLEGMNLVELNNLQQSQQQYHQQILNVQEEEQRKFKLTLFSRLQCLKDFTNNLDYRAGQLSEEGRHFDQCQRAVRYSDFEHLQELIKAYHIQGVQNLDEFVKILKNLKFRIDSARGERITKAQDYNIEQSLSIFDQTIPTQDEIAEQEIKESLRLTLQQLRQVILDFEASAQLFSDKNETSGRQVRSKGKIRVTSITIKRTRSQSQQSLLYPEEMFKSLKKLQDKQRRKRRI